MEIPSDALTAETPRLGGDLRGPPHLPNSPVRAFYQDVFRLATPSAVEFFSLSELHTVEGQTDGPHFLQNPRFRSDLPSRFHYCHHTNPSTYNLSLLASNKHFLFQGRDMVKIQGQEWYFLRQQLT